MTDKIIIDGIDVSECGYLQYKGCNFVQCLIKIANFDLKCEGYNCYYKQLKRKEQECEELKIELKKLREWEQANKPTGICETCTAKSVQKAVFCRKALNEIDNMIQPCCPELYKSCLKCDKYSCSFYKILDIIHKTKEKLNVT